MGAEEKEQVLKRMLRELGAVGVCYSSGVDSAYLLYLAKQVLKDRVIALTVRSHIFPGREYEESVEFCKEHGIRQITVDMDETLIPGFTDNPADRCYLCKKTMFEKIKHAAEEVGYQTICEGTNVDDLSDYRPGFRATREMGILSPLQAAGLTKREIRELSERQNLPTYNKPAYACLASRFGTHERITRKKLAMVEEAEEYLMRLGFLHVRVRIHGDLARIEADPSDLSRMFAEETREQIAKQLYGVGFRYVSLDLTGYRMGSMNSK